MPFACVQYEFDQGIIAGVQLAIKFGEVHFGSATILCRGVLHCRGWPGMLRLRVSRAPPLPVFKRCSCCRAFCHTMFFVIFGATVTWATVFLVGYRANNRSDEAFDVLATTIFLNDAVSSGRMGSAHQTQFALAGEFVQRPKLSRGARPP